MTSQLSSLPASVLTKRLHPVFELAHPSVLCTESHTHVESLCVGQWMSHLKESTLLRVTFDLHCMTAPETGDEIEQLYEYFGRYLGIVAFLFTAEELKALFLSHKLLRETDDYTQVVNDFYSTLEEFARRVKVRAQFASGVPILTFVDNPTRLQETLQGLLTST